MISIIITPSNDKQKFQEILFSIINFNLTEKYELFVIGDEILNSIINNLSKKQKKNIFFIKKESNKTKILNTLFKNLNGRVWVFVGEETHLDNNSIKNILKKFEDPFVGCVTGRPVSSDSRENLFGYWANLLCDAGAHNIRKELNKKGKFLECSGYLYAFRNNITKNIPPNTAADTIIPYLAMKKGYKIKYASDAIVYIKCPRNIRDFISQKRNAALEHEFLEDYAPFFPKVKSFRNEVRKGFFWSLSYARNLKELFWTLILFYVRLYIWIIVKLDSKIIKITTNNKNSYFSLL